MAKLSSIDVVRLRDLYSSGGYSQSVLAEKFGVCSATVSFVVNRVTWRHI